MSDPKRLLAELYQRVVQDELGLLATIEDDGDVLFRHPDLGDFFISLNAEKDPEYMKLVFPAFLFDETRGVAPEDLIRVCNKLNVHAQLAILTFHEEADDTIAAHVGLLLAAPDVFPDETLLRGVIRRAMSSIRSVVEKFADELSRLE
ncbi:MAG: hypothetical protein QOI24_1234 [Acidobacteriota bacterium]|jgi:hypothetical protein|nr:hypothetical protein [Acidobacteriota bacterium]